MPLLSECSHSTCFEVDRVNGKDRETGDTVESTSGPLGDRRVILHTGLTANKVIVLRPSLVELVIPETENHHATRRKATIFEIPSG